MDNAVISAMSGARFARRWLGHGGNHPGDPKNPGQTWAPSCRN